MSTNSKSSEDSERVLDMVSPIVGGCRLNGRYDQSSALEAQELEQKNVFRTCREQATTTRINMKGHAKSAFLKAGVLAWD